MGLLHHPVWLQLASDLLSVSLLGWLIYVLLISIIFGQSSLTVRRGWGLVGDLITWHKWIFILFVAFVFGIRPPRRGESTSSMYIYLYWIIISFDAWLWYWFMLLVFLHTCDIFVCSVLFQFRSLCILLLCMSCYRSIVFLYTMCLSKYKLFRANVIYILSKKSYALFWLILSNVRICKLCVEL